MLWKHFHRRRVRWWRVSWAPCQCHCSSSCFRNFAGLDSVSESVHALYPVSSVTCLMCFFPQAASKRRDKSGNPICWSHPCPEGFRDSVQSDSRILLGLLLVRQKGHSQKRRWKNKIFLFSTFVEGHKRGQTVLDIRLLQELWTPLMKVKLTWFSPIFAGPPCEKHCQRCWSQF